MLQILSFIPFFWPIGTVPSLKLSGSSKGTPAQHWKAQNQPPDLSSISRSGSKLVAVGDRILASDNGLQWDVVHSEGVSNLYSVVWSGSLFVTGGDYQKVFISPDGIKWVTHNLELPRFTTFFDMIWTGDRFMAVGCILSSSAIFTSPDGKTWETLLPGAEHPLFGIVKSGDVYVTVGLSGIILTSDNGKDWHKQALNESSTLVDVTFSDLGFVAVGSTQISGGKVGLIRTSTNGKSWTTHTQNDVEDFHSIAWSGSLFVATASSGKIVTSPDAMTWTTRHSGTCNTLRDVVWTGTQFVAVGDQGTILTSPDGINPE